MILGGNWIVGRYKLDFFNPDSGDNVRLRRVLASIIPWLSSTQGFSRAIAQIMVHAVIPLVIDVNEKNESLADSDWFLRLIYRFLSENREMSRLRNKQTKFFARYNIEEMCSPEGVLGVPVDEGDEADPVHLVDAMKEALKEVYEEAHLSDAPVWKQVEEVLQSQRATDNDDDSEDESNDLVNFQRKIIPLDALNLAMEDLREKRLRNAAGQRKQQLIVCASLVDKVPNLGGLARTAEIFAADRLIIPDMAVTKMDNFKGLSVGAGDWIEMEEVRQEVRETGTRQVTKRRMIIVILTKICSEHLMKNTDPNNDGYLNLFLLVRFTMIYP
jgi:tRNA guanosine-2'-O-methyltransferase